MLCIVLSIYPFLDSICLGVLALLAKCHLESRLELIRLDVPYLVADDAKLFPWSFLYNLMCNNPHFRLLIRFQPLIFVEFRRDHSDEPKEQRRINRMSFDSQQIEERFSSSYLL